MDNMADDRLHSNSENQQRDATRLLPSFVLSPSDRDAIVDHVVKTVCEYNPVQLLTGFAFPSLLLHPTDSHPAFIEYLQHLIITHTPVGAPADVSEDLVNKLFVDIKNLFGSVSFERAVMSAASRKRNELVDSLAMDALYIRGKSYLLHQRDMVERLFGSVDNWLGLHMGVSSTDVVRTIEHLFVELNSKANAAIPEMRQVIERPKNGSFGMVLEHDIFRITPPGDGVVKVLRILAASPGSKPPPSSLLPGRVWATSRDHPILEFRGKFYCFNPQSVVDELPRLLSEWIAAHDKPFFDRRYARLREDLLTDMAIASLLKVFPDAEWGKNLYYADDSKTRPETDGLVIYDDVAIVIESKAGALSFSARQGRSQRIERDFGALVGKAFSQARRTATFIGDNPQSAFTDERGKPVLSLAGKTIRKIYLMNPVLDSMDAFAIELADARASGLLASDKEWPWCVFINDLRLVTDILDSPSVFLLYMDRRLRFNAHSSWFRVHDEVDLLDYFLHTGLFLEEKPIKEADFVQWQADSRDLDAYYAAKVLGAKLPPKPHPPFLPEILALVQSIEQSGVPGRMALAMEILSLGEESHRKILDTLSLLPARLAQRHLPQSGNFTREGVGVSFWFVENLSPKTREHLLFEDRCNKYEHHANEWLSAVFLLQSGQRSMVEITRNDDPWREDPVMQQTVQALRDTKFEMRRNMVRAGRNDPCPCGSGKKFKKCHGRQYPKANPQGTLF